MGVVFEKELAFLCGEARKCTTSILPGHSFGRRPKDMYNGGSREKHGGEGASAAEVPTVNGQNLSYWLKNVLNNT